LVARVGIVSEPLRRVRLVSVEDIVRLNPVGLLVDTVTGRLAVLNGVVKGLRFSETVLEGIVTARLGWMETL
jgi:hypothetical protein